MMNTLWIHELFMRTKKSETDKYCLSAVAKNYIHNKIILQYMMMMINMMMMMIHDDQH